MNKKISLLGLFLLIMILPSAMASVEYPTQANLFMNLSLDEGNGSTAFDLYNGGSRTWNVQGPQQWSNIGIDGAYDLNGTSYLTAPRLQFNTSSFTFGAKVQSYNWTQPNIQYIWHPRGTGDIRINIGGGDINFFIFSGTANNCAIPVPPEGNFSDIGMSYNGTHILGYVDNVTNVCASGTPGGPSGITDYLGSAFNQDPNTYLNGTMDEVFMYSGTAMTQQELSEVFSYQGMTPPPPCVENWVCNGYDTPVCLPTDNSTASCNSVTDTNACGTNYTGDYTEFANQTGVCDFCTPSFFCGGYGACTNVDNSTNFTRSCIGATDNNSCFSQTGLTSDQYAGNLSEFPDQICEATPAQEASLAQIIFTGLIPIFFVIGAVATTTSFGRRITTNNKVLAGSVSLLFGIILLTLLL